MSKLQKRLRQAGLALVLIIGVSALTLVSQQRGAGPGAGATNPGRGGGRGPAGQGQPGGNGVYNDLPAVFRQEPISIARALGLYNLKHPPREGVAIKAGRLFDAPTGRMLTNQVILVNGDMIRQVGPANVVQIPTGAQVVDLSNATVIPGLIDAHVHIMDSILE